MVSKFRDVSHKLPTNNSVKPFQFFLTCVLLHVGILTKTYSPYTSLVSTLSLSIYDKTAAKKAIVSIKNLFFLDIETTFRLIFPSCNMQCLPRGNPRNLCANARIQSLVAHIHSKVKVSGAIGVSVGGELIIFIS